MHALILAAGLGSRLGKHTRDRTKAMVEVNGRTLIARALDALALAGIGRVTLVTGHGAAALEAHVGTEWRGMQVAYIHNPIYEQTNNIYSLWLARQVLTDDDTILLESDIIFEPRIIRDVLANPSPNVAVVAPFEPWMDGTVTVLDATGNIMSMVPKDVFDWKAISNYHKTVNVYKFSRDFAARFYLPFLDAFISAFGRSRYYEQVLTAITQLSKTELVAHRLTDEVWYEIDDIQDLDIAETLFSGSEQALQRYQSRYGGYWRFPHLKDFCYLVNPYFPTPAMFEEMKASFGELVASYPSGHAVQSILAAKAFACDPSEILVGNGAAELIHVLVRELPGRIVVPRPTFEEYTRLVPKERIVSLPATAPAFEHGVDSLVDAARSADVLILVNPGNPSGGYLPVGAVLDLCERLRDAGTWIVLDESFLDFVALPDEHSLLSSDVLRRFPKLVVVKSISKSYGVPGLRLGVVASADPALVARLKAALPVWNVGSTGEFFLQILGKYTREYAEACRLIAADRDALFEALGAIPFLRVVPSRANYFLCELTARFTATELTRSLLLQHRILVKDCTGKPGLESGQYVRFAVRDRRDNEALVAALRTLGETEIGHS